MPIPDFEPEPFVEIAVDPFGREELIDAGAIPFKLGVRFSGYTALRGSFPNFADRLHPYAAQFLGEAWKRGQDLDLGRKTKGFIFKFHFILYNSPAIDDGSFSYVGGQKNDLPGWHTDKLDRASFSTSSKDSAEFVLGGVNPNEGAEFQVTQAEPNVGYMFDGAQTWHRAVAPTRHSEDPRASVVASVIDGSFFDLNAIEEVR